MADQNPTGGGRLVTLDFRYQTFLWLRQTITSCLLGASADLANPRRLPDRERAREEEFAYRRLLGALNRGKLYVPDEGARRAVEVIAVETDRANDYERAVFEHEALHQLLDVLADRAGSA